MLADNTSFFSVEHEPETTELFLNKYLLKINQWAYQSKMLFNPDTSQQAQKIFLSLKKTITTRGTLFFENFTNSQGEYTRTRRSVSGYKIKFCDTYH